jgi:hypothetical protein
MSHLQKTDLQMPRCSRKDRYLTTVLCIAFFLLFLAYARIHSATIGESWPLTLREPAFIIQTDALLDPEAPPMYSWESLPEQTNLYGPIYPISALPLAALLDDAPYIAHRLTTGLFLILSCTTLGFLIGRKSGKHYGWIGAVFFYITSVASPSVAAGPDTLSTFFYIAAIGIAYDRGFNWKSILACAMLGFAGLLTKPYTVLVIPGMLTYCYLFVSPKRALFAAVAIATVSLLGFGIISYCLPAYFHTVFGMHSFYATRFLEELLSQIQEFAYLHFSLLALFAFGFPYRSLGSLQKPTWSRLFGNQPLFSKPLGFDRFMTIIAASVLLISLGWHGGAYLIYFNHLLLPPLILASLSRADTLERHFRLSHILLLANALLVFTLLPSQPKNEAISPAIYKALQGGTVLIDPVLEPLTSALPDAHLADNGQAEYLINYDRANKNSPSRPCSKAWFEKESSQIGEGAYDYLLLTHRHNRPHLFLNREPTQFMQSHYELFGYFEISVYYVSFRERGKFGNQPLPISIFKRKANLVSN